MAGRLQEGTQHKALCLRSAERNRVFVMRKIRMEHPVFARLRMQRTLWAVERPGAGCNFAFISDAEFSRFHL